MNDKVEQFLHSSGINFIRNVSLKDKTWIKRGGVTAFWIQPEKIEHLVATVKFLNKEHIPFEVVGHTSNLYFVNEYNPIVVVSTISLNNFSENEDLIVCECGVITKKLANFAVKMGYVGFEGLVDLPGTIGSAIHNNSGCYNCLVSDLLYKLDYLKSNGEIIELYHKDMLYEKRNSVLKSNSHEFANGVILKVYLKINRSANPGELLKLAEKNHLNRLKYQDKAAQNLGSVYYMLPWRFLPKIVIGMVVIMSNVFQLNKITREQLKRNFLVFFFGGSKIKKYISKRTVNRFFFLDQNADEAFVFYQKFIQRLAVNPKIEIEIKNGES